MNLDPRIRILIILIKFWGKIHELTGHNRITNYSLVMLICFYLQQLKEPLLPKISYLQSLVSRPEIIEDWDFRFSQNNLLLYPIFNKQSIHELLLGFFEYYATFDWGNKVISLNRGEIFDKNIFTSPDTLPEGFEILKTYYLSKSDPQIYKEGAMSVQVILNILLISIHFLTRSLNR